MDSIDKELEKRAGKAPVDEGTSSRSLQSKIDQRNEPNKNVATLNNDAKVVKDKGQQKATTPPLKKNEYRNPFRYVHPFNGYCFSCTNFGHMARDYKVVGMYNY